MFGEKESAIVQSRSFWQRCLHRLRSTKRRQLSIRLCCARTDENWWTASHVRSEVVQFLETNCDRADTEGTESDFRQFMPNCNWRSYLEKMRKCGEFGDHVTLQACARRFGVQIIVLSTSGTNYTQLIPCKPVVADETSVSSPVMIVGHYPDESVEGGHFVVLSPIPPKTPQGIMVSRMHVTDSGAQTSTDIECASDDGSDLTAEDNDDVELSLSCSAKSLECARGFFVNFHVW